MDTNEYIMDFINEMWVRCPHCSACAIILVRDAKDIEPFAARRLICTKCPYTADWNGRELAFPWYSRPADPCFGYDLWLQESCCSEVLWAYNPKHLSFLFTYIGAKNRKRTKDEQFGWCNKSLASRLPKWMQSAKNRNDVMKAIRKLIDATQAIKQGAQPDAFGAGQL